ncbi:hypothetical protein F5X96DRAFT_623473 [Biscogniauxia mediterranea]|nr:hypothetical protein F5X96DRAFT_623473 [Biscogniauxia mediterranea]
MLHDRISILLWRVTSPAVCLCADNRLPTQTSPVYLPHSTYVCPHTITKHYEERAALKRAKPVFKPLQSHGTWHMARGTRLVIYTTFNISYLFKR